MCLVHEARIAGGGSSVQLNFSLTSCFLVLRANNVIRPSIVPQEPGQGPAMTVLLRLPTTRAPCGGFRCVARCARQRAYLILGSIVAACARHAGRRLR